MTQREAVPRGQLLTDSSPVFRLLSLSGPVFLRSYLTLSRMVLSHSFTWSYLTLWVLSHSLTQFFPLCTLFFCLSYLLKPRLLPSVETSAIWKDGAGIKLWVMDTLANLVVREKVAITQAVPIDYRNREEKSSQEV